MIDRKAAQKANTAVRIARDIESESKGKVVTVPVMESQSFGLVYSYYYKASGKWYHNATLRS